MREPKDKRTKAWKEWKANHSEGLGDTIEKITKATGIKKVVEVFSELTGVDCGCDERKKKLNERYRYEPNCFVLSEYEWFTEYLTRHNEKKYSKGDVFELVRLYTRIFKIRPKICSNCNSGVLAMQELVRDLKKIYETY